MAKAYIQSLQNRDGDSVYPVTTGDAVYLQKTDSDGVITQQTLTKKLESMETSFQDGVDTIVAALTELGVTPESTTPAGIAVAIKAMYSARYDAGVEQGHKDVIADPGAYGLITQDEYDAYGVEKYDAGIKYADSRVNTSSASYTQGYSDGKLGASISASMASQVTATATIDTGGYYAQARGYIQKMDIALSDGVLTLSGNVRCFLRSGDGLDTTENTTFNLKYNVS